jgi:hypothetical protein
MFLHTEADFLVDVANVELGKKDETTALPPTPAHAS